MDLSQWYDINNKIKINYTKKKFYKKYLHRLDYHVPCAHFLRMVSTTDQLYLRVYGHYNRYQQLPVDSVIKRLDVFLNLLNKETIKKIRIERSNLAIFDDDLDNLYRLATNELKDFQQDIKTLVTVKNNEELEILNQNYIIARMPTDYLYRVNLRSGLYHNLEERHGFAKYLAAVGTEIKITKNLLSTLLSTNKYLQGGYFYVRDPDIISMILLIMPRIVLSVDPLVVKPNQ